jgi:hypothetical protein
MATESRVHVLVTCSSAIDTGKHGATFLDIYLVTKTDRVIRLEMPR